MLMTMDHYSIITAFDVAQIAEPLFNSTQFGYFSYFREFFDGSRILLSTNPEWTYFLYNQDYSSITEFNPKLGMSNDDVIDKTGNFLWEWLPNLLQDNEVKLKFYSKMKDSQDFNINSGISIIKKIDRDHEYFNFGTSKSSAYIYKFYFNHIDILKRFVVYFKIKAAHLIDKSYDHKLFIPSSSLPLFPHDQDLETASLLQFIENTAIQKYPVCYNGINSYISHRQLECLYFLSQGLSAKEIALKLFISFRTVEKHLQLLKEEYSLNTKADLLKVASLPIVRDYFIVLCDSYLV